MRRRALLASLSAGAAFLAGCSGRSRPAERATRTAEPTPPPDVTTITETKPLPEPDRVSSPDAARSFVERHERRFVYNELVGGFGTRQPAIDISVDPPAVDVVHDTDSGFFFLSTCTGEAEYYDPDGSPTTAGRNAASVAHFVGGGTHRRIPFNAYRCHDAVASTPTESDSAARFQLYDFATPLDRDRSEREGYTVDVDVRDGSETVLDRTYRTELPLSVQPNATREPGSYTLSASLAAEGADDGTTVERDWSPSSPADATWWALALLITPDERLLARELYPNETTGLPESTLCGGL